MVDWIANAPIHQPASAALVQAQLPGCVELPGGRQRRALFLAASGGLVVREALGRAHVEHLTCGGVWLNARAQALPR